MKVENHYSGKLPKHTLMAIEKFFLTLPAEHLRGIEKLRLVDKIIEPKLRMLPNTLPSLYHPRQGASQAWIEISLDALLPKSETLFKRVSSRMTYKNNLAVVITSLVGQHYHLTFRHSIKKTQLEASVRAYTETHLRKMSANNQSLRSRLLKPLQPSLEKWIRNLQKRTAKSQTKLSR